MAQDTPAEKNGIGQVTKTVYVLSSWLCGSYCQCYRCFFVCCWYILCRTHAVLQLLLQSLNSTIHKVSLVISNWYPENLFGRERSRKCNPDDSISYNGIYIICVRVTDSNSFLLNLPRTFMQGLEKNQYGSPPECRFQS